MRTSFSVAAIAAFSVLATGCSNFSRNTPVVIFTDMDYQKRYEPQGDRSFDGNKGFFADQRSSRRPVEGTLVRLSTPLDEAAASRARLTEFMAVLASAGIGGGADGRP